MKKEFWQETLILFCTLMLGLCLTVWADKVTSLFSIILGTLISIYGLVAIIDYFRNQNKIISDRIGFIFGIIMLVIGGVLIFKVDFLKELISFIVGLYIILTSITRLQMALRTSRELNIKMPSAIILGIIGLLLGIMCVVGKFILPDMIVKYIGILLIIYSIISFIELIIIKRK